MYDLGKFGVQMAVQHSNTGEQLDIQLIPLSSLEKVLGNCIKDKIPLDLFVDNAHDTLKGKVKSYLDITWYEASSSYDFDIHDALRKASHEGNSTIILSILEE